MPKIKGWKKSRVYEAKYSSRGIYGDVYENMYTGEILWLDKVVGGGWVISIWKKEWKEPRNFLGSGVGIRTLRYAKQIAIDFMRTHPRG